MEEIKKELKKICKTEQKVEYANKTILDYRQGKLIGKGSYAMVKIARDRTTREKVAMKIYEKSKL